MGTEKIKVLKGKRQNTMRLEIDALPPEILRHIWSFLPCNGTTWKNIPLVCKLWHKLSRGKDAPLCTSKFCSAERSVVKTLLHGDADMLRHVWEDEHISVQSLIEGNWFTEMLLSIESPVQILHILKDKRVPKNFDVSELMRRSCRTGRSDVVCMLLDNNMTTVDVHDFTEACWCLEERNDDRTFAMLLCHPSIDMLLSDPILVDCLTRNHHHRVLRWLLHWESAFCTREAMERLFLYCMTSQVTNRIKGCESVAMAAIYHCDFPWDMIKADFVKDVAVFGWAHVLKQMLIHLTVLQDAPQDAEACRHFCRVVLDNATLHGKCECIMVLAESPFLQHDQEAFQQVFRRMCMHTKRQDVFHVGRTLIRTKRINLSHNEQSPRRNVWICVASRAHWSLLSYMLNQTHCDIAPPFKENECDLLMCVMSNCPPLSDTECAMRVAEILAQLVNMDTFHASERTMLRLLIYARETQCDALSDALLFGSSAEETMHDLLCSDTPPQSPTQTGSKRYRVPLIHRKPWARKRRLWVAESSSSNEADELLPLQRRDTQPMLHSVE